MKVLGQQHDRNEYLPCVDFCKLRSKAMLLRWVTFGSGSTLRSHEEMSLQSAQSCEAVQYDKYWIGFAFVGYNAV
jgi:hypothetical protein